MTSQIPGTASHTLGDPPTRISSTFPGIQAIYAACHAHFPDQPNPLQVTGVHKFWLGGPDPLDFISMYAHPAIPDHGVPEHWYYVTLGLSDLYGDNRLHGRNPLTDGPSGFGFELTYRVKRESSETHAPTWPAPLLQSLARYVFASQASLCPGDHIPWPRPLDELETKPEDSHAMGSLAERRRFANNEDNGEVDDDEGMVGDVYSGSSGSAMRHMLLVEDPELKRINTLHGYVQFLQIVGLCDEELRLVQQWNGDAVASLLRRSPATGGNLLVTDMRRGESVLTLTQGGLDLVNEHMREAGSSMTGVTTRFTWEDFPEDEKEIDVVGDSGSLDFGAAPFSGRDNWPTAGEGSSLSPHCLELVPPRPLSGGVHLKLAREAGELLPTIVTGRLRHGRHFTLMHAEKEWAVTLVSSRVTGAFVTEDNPHVSRGHWLQIYLTDDFLEQLEYQVGCFTYPEDIKLPHIFCWPERRLKISILPDNAPQLDAFPPMGLPPV